MFNNRRLRNNTFVNYFRLAYREAILSGNYVSRRALIKKVIEESRPLFDVSYDYALSVIHKMRSGKLTVKNPLKCRMWHEIYNYVTDEMRRRDVTVGEALATVLAEKHASQFYISYIQASKILYHEKVYIFHSYRRRSA